MRKYAGSLSSVVIFVKGGGVKILVVEDDPVIGESIKMNLELESFEVFWAKSLEEANSGLENTDLIILDLSLPDGYGIQFCRKLRSQGLETPVLILSAESAEDSVVKGFEAGANDYVKKPFSNKELLARVRSWTKSSAPKRKVLQFLDLTLDSDRRTVMHKEKELFLNRREFDLLQLLMENPGCVVRRELILERLTGGDILDRTLDSHISHLRAKLKSAGVEEMKVRAEYGVGYRMVASE